MSRPANNAIPENEETTEEDMNLLKVQRLVEGAANYTWFLTLGITLKGEMTGK